ncbi:hypothetical protein LVJ82_01470 [Vitreoscilla massiliensis]|uniref:Uncharacterized protein n=1 Tax=Vitreoscilla massiliensis TaxID=1689272 RepID=A0ABY4E4B0_9NEIS|nr:hypothetical protein [Vitreoscilla massiliensis]UOO89685.1 hypothetical protein LVJ82_01470 [Vitreoscilla massiliensis]
MFVRRLLVSAVLACLAACAAPTSTFVVDKNPNLKQSTAIGSVNALDYQLMPKRSAAAFSTTVSTQNASSTALCLQQHLSSEFKLPPEFVSHKVYTDNNHSVGLINPFTQVEGITMDVVNKGGSSEIKLYDNGNLLSRAWKQLPSKCGQGKTTTLAQDTGSSKTSAKAPSGIDFVSAGKSGSSIADSSKPVFTAAAAPAVIKATPLVKAEPIRVVKDTAVTTPLQAATTPVRNIAAYQASPLVTPKVVATAANASAITASTPRIVAIAEPITATPANNTTSATSSAWNHGDLTQDDMSIIAPATAAVVTPAMAIAAQNMAAQEAPHLAAAAKQVATSPVQARSVKASVAKPNTSSTKALETSKTKTAAAATRKKVNNTAAKEDSKTTAASKNTKNSKQTAKESASNSRSKANDSKNSRNKADKAEDSKNNRSKNSKANAAEEKASSKNKSSRNKADSKADDNKNSKGKKTAERNVKEDNSKNSKKKTDNKANDNSKNNKKAAPERDNNSKAKASSNKSKATDKKAESAKKTPKKDKSK